MHHETTQVFPLAALISSPFVHPGLVAQFGPETFGAAWDYAFFWNKTLPLVEKRQLATLDTWLACGACRVGSANRQARFLAGLATTGDLSPAEEAEAAEEAAAAAAAVQGGGGGGAKGGARKGRSGGATRLRADVELLGAAVAALKLCAFVGLMER
jgi:hypothetical protein